MNILLSKIDHIDLEIHKYSTDGVHQNSTHLVVNRSNQFKQMSKETKGEENY